MRFGFRALVPAIAALISGVFRRPAYVKPWSPTDRARLIPERRSRPVRSVLLNRRARQLLRVRGEHMRAVRDAFNGVEP